MSELKISPNEIRDALKDFVSSFEPQGTDKQEVGYVIDAGDGIAHGAGIQRPDARKHRIAIFCVRPAAADPGFSDWPRTACR